MSRQRLDPKDFPFNYVVHCTDTEGKYQSVDFAKYYDAEGFISSNFPELEVDSQFGEMDASGSSYWSGHEYSKIAWSKEGKAKHLELRAEFEHGDYTKDGEDIIALMMDLEGSQVRLERKRDAYDEACLEAAVLDEFLDDDADYDEEEDDVYGLCPVCSSEEIALISGSKMRCRCYECHQTFAITECKLPPD